jgi:hypothetical protein
MLVLLCSILHLHGKLSYFNGSILPMIVLLSMSHHDSNYSDGVNIQRSTSMLIRQASGSAITTVRIMSHRSHLPLPLLANCTIRRTLSSNNKTSINNDRLRCLNNIITYFSHNKPPTIIITTSVTYHLIQSRYSTECR